MKINFTNTGSVLYTASILENGKVVREFAPKHNLILDQGLNDLCDSRSWANSFIACAVGSGTSPTKRDSGSVTFSISGGVVTASANFFESGDDGRLLKLDTGEEYRITSYTSATSVGISDSGATATDVEGTVWYVNDTGLETEYARTGNLSASEGSHGTSFHDGNVYTMKRTFIFDPVSETVTIREIGWSYTTSPGANLFGRDVLAGGGITLVDGQQLRVVVELSIEFSPSVATAVDNVGGAFDTAGTAIIEGLGIGTTSDNAFHMVNSSGQTRTGGNNNNPTPAGGFLEAYQSSKRIGAITANWTQQTATQSGNGNTKSVVTGSGVAGSYTAGSFYKEYSYTFGIDQANGLIYGLQLSAQNSGANGFTIKFDSAQTKLNTHTLKVDFRISVNRNLSN